MDKMTNAELTATSNNLSEKKKRGRKKNIIVESMNSINNETHQMDEKNDQVNEVNQVNQVNQNIVLSEDNKEKKIIKKKRKKKANKEVR